MIRLYLLAVCTILLAMSGCGWQKGIEEAKPVGFIEFKEEGSEGVVTDNSPFNYLWQTTEYKADLQRVREEGYSIHIMPVGVEYLSFEGKEPEFEKLVNGVAEYFQQEIVEKTKALDDSHIQPVLTDSADEAEFVLQLQLSEVGLGEPLLYTAAWAIPLPGTSTAYDSMHTSVLAFEGKLIHRESDMVLCEFADRRIPKIRVIIDLNKLTSTSAPLRDVADDWAVEISNALTTRLDKSDIKGEGFITLIPW